MLELTDVVKRYREPDGQMLTVLDLPAFRLSQAEQMVLVGRSGSGKTTLLHVIAGITRPDAGQVLVAGTEVTRLSEAQADRFRAQNIGYVFQTFNLLAAFSALENVLLGMTFGGARPDERRARQLLDRVGLSSRLSHKPGALSVGEQQRVAVARALANRPRLVLADEPTSNVDPANQQRIIELLREACREEQIALLLVTHTAEVCSQFDRVERLEELTRQSSPAPVRAELRAEGASR